jgi:DNA-binding GntR family transcriptional regulator
VQNEMFADVTFMRPSADPLSRSPHGDTPKRRPAVVSPGAPETPAYLALANSLEVQVQANVFRPGDRLPSVRTLCGDHRLSMETVLHTLRVLEDRGVVEARPRSGFYIIQKSAAGTPASAAPIGSLAS